MRDKLYQRFKSNRWLVDKEIYKEMQNVVKNLIWKKKQVYFGEKLKENITNLEKLWTTLKQLGLPEKRSPSQGSN